MKVEPADVPMQTPMLAWSRREVAVFCLLAGSITALLLGLALWIAA